MLLHTLEHPNTLSTHHAPLDDIHIGISSFRKLRVSLITGSIYASERKTTAAFENLMLTLKLISYRHCVYLPIMRNALNGLYVLRRLW